jgi:hypothetical protein
VMDLDGTPAYTHEAGLARAGQPNSARLFSTDAAGRLMFVSARASCGRLGARCPVRVRKQHGAFVPPTGASSIWHPDRPGTLLAQHRPVHSPFGILPGRSTRLFRLAPAYWPHSSTPSAGMAPRILSTGPTDLATQLVPLVPTVFEWTNAGQDPRFHCWTIELNPLDACAARRLCSPDRAGEGSLSFSLPSWRRLQQRYGGQIVEHRRHVLEPSVEDWASAEVHRCR